MPTPLQTMRAMTEAGFTYPEVWHNYDLCVEFIKYLNAHDSDYYRQTRELLKKIGEYEDAKKD